MRKRKRDAKSSENSFLTLVKLLQIFKKWNEEKKQAPPLLMTSPHLGHPLRHSLTSPSPSPPLTITVPWLLGIKMG